MIESLFWIAMCLIIYTFGVFPIFVFGRGRFARRRYHEENITPRVSLVIAAYNEQEHMEAKLSNVVDLDYPADRLEVLVVSDGSNDGTEEIVRRYADRGVRLLALPRRGKAAALNEAVARSDGEMIVFSDANSIYAPDAIRALMRPLADPSVGGVAGNQVYHDHSSTGLTARGEQQYWNFDRRLKRAQSNAGSVTSATGAIYAIRRTLFSPIPEGVTDDFVTSARVVAQGHRLVFAADALAYEPVAGSNGIEFGRKVRIITRGLRGVLCLRELLNPLRYGFYAIQIFSHKILRRLMGLPLAILFVSNLWLWDQGLFYQAAGALQLIFYGCATLGLLIARTRFPGAKVASLPFFFCLVNCAGLLAMGKFLMGRKVVLWEPQRSRHTKLT